MAEKKTMLNKVHELEDWEALLFNHFDKAFKELNRELDRMKTEDKTMKQTVVFDFDGVIHSYTSGWQGTTVIPDPPVPGIKEAIAEIRAAGYEVVIVSTRCATAPGYGAIRAWLRKYGIVVDDVKTEKPPAVVYIDDRAICFDGKPEQLLSKIQAFKPWNK